MDARSPSNEAADYTAFRSADSAVGWTSLAGLVLSIGTMTLGLILTLVRSDNAARHVLPLDRLLPTLAQGKGTAVLDLGIVFLFATPLVGILVALAQFVRQKDSTFAAISLIIVALLCVDFLVALR